MTTAYDVPLSNYLSYCFNINCCFRYFRMLFRISKFIPNDKLESYLKTYKDVNNEIRIKSSTPDNWATWCSERYECNNNSNNVSRATNTNK